MAEILDSVMAMLVSQGPVGAMLLIMIYAYYKQSKSKDDLHKLMYEEAEKDNVEKIGYLNEHVVVMTKMTEAMKSSTVKLTEMEALLRGMAKDMEHLERGLNKEV